HETCVRGPALSEVEGASARESCFDSSKARVARTFLSAMTMSSTVAKALRHMFVNQTLLGEECSQPHGLCYTPAVSQQRELAAGLYLVATPIGNMEDITLRAIRVLKQCDLIACEDTRQTQKLLNHHAIETPTISYHEHNEASRAAELIEKLAQGIRMAVVSDAGTPGISDPGFRLVSLAIQRGVPIVPIPGPVAFVSALVASGLAVETFSFRGFLPPKTGARRRELERIRNLPQTQVF